MYPETGENGGKPDALDRLVRQDIIRTHESKVTDEHVSDIDWSELGDLAGKKNVAFTSASDIRNERAANQGIFWGLANGVAQTLRAAPYRIMAATGEMLDLGDYFNGSDFDKTFGGGEDEYGNFFSNWIRENMVTPLEKTHAVYKYDDVSLLGTSPIDPKWWKNFSADLTSIAGSATEFAGAGFGIGGLISKGLRTAGMITTLGKTINGQRVTTGLERLLTATATNQAEALGSAADVHQRVYKKAITEGETIGTAEKKASIAAATAMNLNRINIALNLTSVGVFGRGMFGTRAEAGEKLATGLDYAKEAGQEFLEEVNNFTAEKIGEQAAENGKEIGFAESFGADSFKQRWDSIMANPQQALEAGVLGAIGGAGQTAATTALASSKILAGVEGATGSTSFGKWTGKVFGEDVVVFDEKGNAKEKPRGENGEFNGYETERVTKAEANKRRYDRQQTLGKEYENIFSKENSKGLWDTFQSTERQQSLYIELNEAKKKGDVTRYNQLRETMLQERAYEAFETGTAGTLIGAMESETNRQFSEQEIIDRGLPPDYKKNLQEGIAMVKELEKEYIESKMYNDSELIYNTKANTIRAKRYKNAAQTAFNAERNNFNIMVQEAIDDKKLTKTKGTVKKEVITRKRRGEPLTGLVDAEKTIEDVASGDYAGILNGEIKVSKEDTELVAEFMNELSELFPAEVQKLGKVAADIHAFTDIEYSYRDAHNKLRSAEHQKAANKKAEDNVVLQNQQAEDIEKQKKKEAELKKQQDAINKTKEQAATAEALQELSKADNVQEEESSNYEDFMNDNIPEMEESGKNEGSFEIEGKEDFDGGYDPDTDTGKLGNTADFRGQNAKARKPMNMTRNRPANKPKEVKNKDSEAKQDAKKSIMTEMKDIIDKINPNQTPGDKPNKLNLKDEAIGELVRLNRRLIDEVFEGVEPAWADMLQEWVSAFGEQWARKSYPYIASIYGIVTGEHITTSFDQTLGTDAKEAADLLDIHDKFEEEIDDEMYTVDTEDRQLDKAKAQIYNTYEDAIDSEEYQMHEEEGGKENKTYTGHNILAYMAIAPEMDGATPDQKRKEIFDNMDNPMLMSTKHFGVGTELKIETANDDNILVVNKFQNGKKTTFAQYKIDAKAKHGDTKAYEWAVREEQPLVVTDKDGNPIGYIHGMSWINAKNVSQKKMDIKDQRLALMNFRQEILKANGKGKPYTTEITTKLPGKLIFQKDKSGRPVSSSAATALPDKNLQLTIGTTAGFNYGETNPDYDTMSDDSKATPGGIYVMLPVNTQGTVKTIASPLLPNTLSNEIVDSIEQAINAFMDKTGEYDGVKKQLNDVSGINLDTTEGLETYIKQFLYTLSFNKTKGQLGTNAIQRFINYAEGYKGKDKVYLQMINGVLYMARGSGYTLTNDVNADNAPKLIAISKTNKEWEHNAPFFLEMLRDLVYTKVAKEAINSNNVEIWALTPEGVTNLIPDGDYNQFVKDNSRTFVSGVNLGSDSNPDYTYTVQPIIEIDTKAEQKEETIKEEPVQDEISISEIKDTNITNSPFKQNTTFENIKPGDSFKYKGQTVTVKRIYGVKGVNEMLTLTNDEKVGREDYEFELVNQLFGEQESKLVTEETSKQEVSDTKAVVEKRKELANDAFEKLIGRDARTRELAMVGSSFGAAGTAWDYIIGKIVPDVNVLVDHALAQLKNGISLKTLSTYVQLAQGLNLGKEFIIALKEEIIKRHKTFTGNSISEIANNLEMLELAKEISAKYDTELAELESKEKAEEQTPIISPKEEMDKYVDAVWKLFTTRFNAYKGKDKIKAIRKADYLKGLTGARKDTAIKVWNELVKRGIITLSKQGWATDFIPYIDPASMPESTPNAKLKEGATEIEKLLASEEWVQEARAQEALDFLTASEEHKDNPATASVRKEHIAILKALGYDVDEDVKSEIVDKPTETSVNVDDEFNDILFEEDLKGKDFTQKGKGTNKDPRILLASERKDIGDSLSEILIPELGAIRQQEIVDNIVSVIISSVFEGGKEVTSSEALNVEVNRAKEQVEKAKGMIPRIEAAIEKGATTIQGKNAYALLDTYRNMEFLFQAVIDNASKLDTMVTIKLQKMKGISVNQEQVVDEHETGDGTSSYEKDQLNENASITTDSKKTVGANVRRFLANLADKQKNLAGQFEPKTTWTGAQKIVPFDEVFNALSAILAGVKPEYDSMIEALREETEVHGWIDDLIKKLERAKNDKDLSIVNEFVVAMSKHQINMKFVFWEYNESKKIYIAKVTDSNQAALGKAIQNSWYDGLLRSGLLETHNGVKSFGEDTKLDLLTEFDAIRNYKLVTKGSITFDDVNMFYVDNQIKEVGQSVFIDKIPSANPMSNNANLPAFVSRNNLVLKVEKTRDGSGRLIITRMPADQAPESVIRRAMLQQWLRKLGIDLDTEVLSRMETDGIKIPGESKPISLKTWLSPTNKHENNPFYHVYKSIADDKIIDLESNRSMMIHSGLQAIAKMQAKHERKVFSNSFQSGKKTVYTYTANKYATDRLRELKTNPQLVEDLFKLDFSKHSLWLQDFLTENGKAKESNPDNLMEIGYVSLQAIKQKGAKNRDDKSLLDVSPADHEWYKMALFMDMKEGRNSKGERIVSFLYPTVPAEKSSRFVVKNKAHKVGFHGNSVSQPTLDLFYEHVFMSEYKRIIQHQKTGNINQKEYDAGAELFYFFPKLNAMKELWGVDGKILNVADKGIKEKIYKVIKETIDDAVEQKLTQWDRFGFTKGGTDGKAKALKYVDHEYVKDIRARKTESMDEVRAAAYDFEVNQMFATANMFQIFIGDPAVFHKESTATKSVTPILKRHIMVQEWMKAAGETVAGYNKKVKANEEDPNSKWNTIDKALSKKDLAKYAARADAKLNGVKDKGIVPMTKHQKMLMLAEMDSALANQYANEMVKEVFTNVGKRLSADVAPGHDLPNTKGEKVKYLFMKSIKSKSINKAYLETLALKGINSYDETEGADSQEYTTWEEHLHILLKLGKITQNKYNLLHNKLSIGQELNEELLKEVLQPMKPVYTGNIADISKGFERRMFIKTSAFPLLPQLTKGLEIDKLRSMMQTGVNGKPIQRAVVISGVKVGAPTGAIDVFDENNNVNNNFTKDQLLAATLDLPRSNFRIQMEVPYKESKKAINVGTQERKLLFTNIRDVRGFSYEGKTNLLGRELEDEYNAVYGKLFKAKYDKLMKRIIDQETGELNKRELQKLLKEEAADRGYPLADLLGLDTVVNENKELDFIIPLWANPSHKAFESLMISVVQNNINKMKFNGGSFVVGSEEGMKVFGMSKDDDGNFIEDDVETYDAKVADFVKTYDGHMAWTKNWQGKLHPAGKYWATADKSRRYTQKDYESLSDDYKKELTEQVLPSQTLIPSKFRGRDGNLIDMKRFVNPETGFIDEAKIPKELMEFFEFRIPTQGHNSMSWSEVVGFLPPESGDLMIVSRDLVTQKGLDFDVDKEYVYFPHMKEVYDEEDPAVIKAEEDYMNAFEKYIGKDLIEELNSLKIQTKANPWVERQFKGDMLFPIIKANLDSKYHKALNKLSEEALYDLHQSGYTRHYGDYTPLNIKYKGATHDMMVAIKQAIQVSNQHYVRTIQTPHKRLKEVQLQIREANAIELTPYKEALQKAKDENTKFLKVGSDDDILWLYIDGKTLDKNNEPIKIRVATNNAGDILNEEELRESGMMDELQSVYPEGVEKGFRDFASSTVQEKRLMNKILDIHKQVMLHEDVQKYIHEPLAFGDLKGNFDISRKIFDALNARNANNSTFTPMSSEFQRNKLTSGLAGRIGIGSFSLDSVLIAQSQDKGIIINESYVDDEGKTQHVPVNIKFGNVFTRSDGDISGVKVNQPLNSPPVKNTRFETIAAFQSAAVDNENEQILDKINANKHTFAAIRAMAAFGFDEKLISVFLSQDSVLHYVDQMNLSESEVTKAFGSVDFDSIIDEYEEKYKVNWKAEELNRRGYPNSVDELGFEQLFSNIKTGGNSPAYYKQQAAILRKFKFISELGSVQLKKMQMLLKTDSGGFGANFIEVADKYDKFLELLKSSSYENLDRLIGDVVSNHGANLSITRIQELEAQGYIAIGQDWKHAAYYIKPTTVMGSSLVYGLQTANRMFKDIIPYSKIKAALNEIVEINDGKKLGTQDLVEMFDAMKSFIFSHDDAEVIVSERFQDANYTQFNTVSGVRIRLLKDIKDRTGKTTHASLATILNQLKNSKETNIVQTNPFLSRLTTREAEGGINLIEFNAAVDRGFDDTALYAGMADLLADKIELPVINGMPYNTTQLAQDLIAYSYAMGGVQGATNFMRYIPIHYLTQLGFDKGTASLMKGMVKGDGKPTNMLYRFYEQYIQNNPDKAHVMTEFTSPSAAEGKTGLVKKSRVNKGVTGKEYREFYYVYQKDGVAGEDGKSAYKGKYISVNRSNSGESNVPVTSPRGYKLYVWNKDREIYIPMSTAGTSYMEEYDAMNSRRLGINTIFDKWRGITVAGHKTMVNVSPNDRMAQGRWDNYGTPEDYVERHTSYLEYVKTATNDKSLGIFADFFLTQVENLKDTAILVDNTMSARGSYSSPLKELRFNEWEMSKHSKYHKAKTIIHEYVHTTVDKYLDADISKLTTAQAKAVASMKKFHKDFVDKMKAEGKYAPMSEAMDKGLPLDFEQIDYDYAAYSVNEFMTLALTSKPFQQYLKSIPAGKTNLWEKLIHVLTQFFKAIGMEDAIGTRLEETIGAFMTLSDFDMHINIENYISEVNEVAEEATEVLESEDEEVVITDEESQDLLFEMLGISPTTSTEEDAKEDIVPKKKGKMSMGKTTREKNPNADEDIQSLSPKVKNTDELKEGANKTLRSNNLFEEAKRLIAEGRLEFDCKKQ